MDPIKRNWSGLYPVDVDGDLELFTLPQIIHVQSASCPLDSGGVCGVHLDFLACPVWLTGLPILPPDVSWSPVGSRQTHLFGHGLHMD